MVKNKIVCPGCSILCDDIYLELENDKIQHVLNTCTKGFEKFNKINDNRLTNYIRKENGEEKAIDLNESMKILAELLQNSKKPLFLLGNNSSNEEIIKTLELAEKVKGIVSSPGAQKYMNLIRKLKEAKIDIPTYEEMINFVDTMIFWGTNPSSTHLRHASKFSVLTRGDKISKGKEDRYVLLVDIRKTEVRVLTNDFIRLEIGQDTLLIDSLMDILNGKEVTSLEFDFPVKDLVTVHKYLTHSDQIVFFIGDGLLHGDDGLVDKFIDLVKLFKEKGNNVKILPMVETLGINNYIYLMLEKHAGKSNIDFQNQSEIKILGDSNLDQIDLVIYLDYDPVENLAFNSINKLLKKNSVFIGTKKNWITTISSLLIPTLTNFIETSGTAIRLDSLNVKQDEIIKSKLDILPISEVLNKIIEKI